MTNECTITADQFNSFGIINTINIFGKNLFIPTNYRGFNRPEYARVDNSKGSIIAMSADADMQREFAKMDEKTYEANRIQSIIQQQKEYQTIVHDMDVRSKKALEEVRKRR